MNEELLLYNEYCYAMMPHPGFAVIENEMLGDRIIVDKNGEVGKQQTIYVGNLSKFCFEMFGLRDDIVKLVCDNAKNKVSKRIDRLVDIIKIKELSERK